MELSDLYPRGTPPDEVHPEFRGMSLAEWHLRQIPGMAKDPETIAYCTRFFVNGEAPLAWKRAWNPRDSYGMKGMP